MNWMNLPKKFSTTKSAYKIIPLPYEHEVTYGTGASTGPEEIIKASEHLEYYDEQFCVEPYTQGIHVQKPLILPEEPEKAIEAIAKKAEQAEGFPVFLGGDHSVTIGTVRGLEKQGDFSVIVLDAHSDFLYSWKGSTINHATVNRNVVDNHDVLVVGVRSQDKEEAEAIKNDKRINIIKSYEYNKEAFIQLLNNLEDTVYVSIDVDVFDPAFIRNTGTPEPGGLSWDTVIDMLQIIFSTKTVIGADIVEFAPQENFRAEAFSLAKLVNKLFALKNIS